MFQFIILTLIVSVVTNKITHIQCSILNAVAYCVTQKLLGLDMQHSKLKN